MKEFLWTVVDSVLVFVALCLCAIERHVSDTRNRPPY